MIFATSSFVPSALIDQLMARPFLELLPISERPRSTIATEPSPFLVGERERVFAPPPSAANSFVMPAQSRPEGLFCAMVAHQSGSMTPKSSPPASAVKYL